MDIDLTGLVLPERVEAVETSEDGRAARFVIEPLERGYGHTLGNSVRRVLLSSLRGAAVWAFRIDGVVHEHQTIQGVVEDVHQVIQNLKALVISLDADVEDAVLEVQAQGPGPVTAGLIEAPAGISILDPEHHLLTLQEDRELRIELHVRKGRGFVLSDHVDWPSLLAAVDATGAQRIWATHGYREPVVRWFREKGLEAEAVASRWEGELETQSSAGPDETPSEEEA